LPAAILGLALIALSTCAAVPDRAANPHPSHSGAAHWSYEGDTGPAYWHTLDSAYAIAGDGKAQSPIDIDTADLTLDGAPGKPVIAYRATTFSVENNGHTIQATPTAAGNTIILDGATFVLQQFHFHAPSEHRIDGQPFALELHLVHQDSQGAIAVVGLMITPGAYNETLGGIFENVPRKAELNLAELFAGLDGVYRYEGSLTTPPCTEGVAWTLAMRPIELSSSQIEAFRAYYRENNRPVQNRYGRRVYAITGAD
jgi:carbonic anhydrase